MAKSRPNSDNIILEHYAKIAKTQGDTPRSSMRDQYIRNSEVDFYLRELKELHPMDAQINILDLGCGNGHLLSILREAYPKAQLFGLEFTPELFEIAKERKLPNCLIEQGDARKIESFSENSMDIIITERVLINILGRKQQYRVLHNILAWLKPGGHYLLSESFKEPFILLNRAREEMCIEKLEIPPHNLYPYEESFERYREKIGLKVAPQQTPQNFLSTHFYLSRILHILSRPPGGKIWNSEFMKFFNGALPPAVGNYSPILFKIYLKEKAF